MITLYVWNEKIVLLIILAFNETFFPNIIYRGKVNTFLGLTDRILHSDHRVGKTPDHIF